jgi:hypothetical protein
MPWVAGQSGNPKGQRPETIEVKEVRRLAQTKSMDAYKIIEGLMYGAERDTVRLAAALAILRMAGLNMDRDDSKDESPPGPQPQSYALSQLRSAATDGDA